MIACIRPPRRAIRPPAVLYFAVRSYIERPYDHPDSLPSYDAADVPNDLPDPDELDDDFDPDDDFDDDLWDVFLPDGDEYDHELDAREFADSDLDFDDD